MASGHPQKHRSAATLDPQVSGFEPRGRTDKTEDVARKRTRTPCDVSRSSTPRLALLADARRGAPALQLGSDTIVPAGCSARTYGEAITTSGGRPGRRVSARTRRPARRPMRNPYVHVPLGEVEHSSTSAGWGVTDDVAPEFTLRCGPVGFGNGEESRVRPAHLAVERISQERRR